MTRKLDPAADALTARTLTDYEDSAAAFWDHTKDHDVSQNYAALLEAIEAPPPFTLLDFGCGPGRDLAHFASLGHTAVGLEGTPSFVEMARRTGCEVLHQNFLALDLGRERYGGVFANASLFHVPGAHLPRVLGELRLALKPRGVLFSSNPRGDNREGWFGDRYGAHWDLERWTELVTGAGFSRVSYYYRPTGKPFAEQRWLASVWRRQD